jgi:hemoglobin
MNEPSLYERLGGAFAIAAVIDNFSDAVVRNPIAGNTSENPRCGNGARTISTGCQA